MLTRIMNLVACAFLVSVMMTAGCAKQEVVKKDEGIAPPPVVKQAAQPAATVTTLPKQPGTSTTRQEVAPQATAVQEATASPAEVKLQSQLETVYFDFDSSNLSESTRSRLSKNASELKKVPTAKIRIEGNCDERGSAEYNLALGERRARSAQQYLTTLGIEPDRLSIISYGKEKPAVKGDNEAAWAKNRRDEFVVTTP